MWKKEDPSAQVSSTQTQGDVMAHKTPSQDRTGGAERATIGRSITINGEVTGDEDLLIQGKVDGSVELKQQSVTIGQEGRVTATITGRVIVVEGQVDGDLKADEQVVLRATAKVQGDIYSPRVVLEDGATFTGGVDMGDPLGKKSGTVGSSSPQPKKTSETTGSASGTEKHGPKTSEASS
jgi:cytoskeletal protein CcmA (bactofilin family)